MATILGIFPFFLLLLPPLFKTTEGVVVGFQIFLWVFLKFFFENLKSCPRGSETLDMTSEGLGEMFEGDSADTCAEKFPLISMGGRAEGLACADPGARTPIGASGNFVIIFGVMY